MNPGEVLGAWKGLARTPGAPLTGVRARGVPRDLVAWLASDTQNQPHLLVRIERGSESIRWRTQGLHVWIDRFAIGESPNDLFLAIRCEDPGFVETFSLVVSDILVRLVKNPANIIETVLRTLERWKVFWTVPHQGLGREAELGLFGELWFLSRWLGERVLRGVAGWQGPVRSRHDFQFPTCSFEVKTAAGSAAVGPVHKVHGLEQLDDPETGQLYLFSLHVVEDALASNGLLALVEQIENLLHEHLDVADLFRSKLAAMGFSPGHGERYKQHFRIVAEALYTVSDGFPRLTRATFPGGLPAGIQDVAYSLAVTHCAKWRMASAPSDSLFLQLLDGIK